MNDWVKPFERFWDGQIDRIKQRAEEKAAQLRASAERTQTAAKKEKP